MCGERRGEARDTHGPPAGEECWGLDGRMGLGRPSPRRSVPQPRRKSPGGKALPSPSFLRASGVCSPTPRLSGGSRAFVGCEYHPTPDSTPVLPPLVEGRTGAYLSVQGTP